MTRIETDLVAHPVREAAFKVGESTVEIGAHYFADVLGFREHLETVYGAMIALMGLAPNVWVAAVFLAGAGAADMVSGVFRSTIWNQTIPDNLRGRLAGGTGDAGHGMNVLRVGATGPIVSPEAG